MNRHQIYEQGRLDGQSGKGANPYDPAEPSLFMNQPQAERVVHTVTRVDHRGRLPDLAGEEPEYGPVHWHVSCHNSGCGWQPEGQLFEGCERVGYTEERAEELVQQHMRETT